jgi:hypothetical protein
VQGKTICRTLAMAGAAFKVAIEEKPPATPRESTARLAGGQPRALN